MIKIKIGDEVFITTGKDRGKTGKVTTVLGNGKKIVVAGVNIVKKHLKPSATNKRAGIIDLNKPIDLSNAEIICPRCTKKTRIKFDIKAGVKNRICVKCKEVIDNAK